MKPYGLRRVGLHKVSGHGHIKFRGTGKRLCGVCAGWTKSKTSLRMAVKRGLRGGT